MADSYALDHASALADVREAGVAVTLTPPPSSTAAAITGYAMRIKGDPRQYQALSLVESDAPTLLFVPSTFAVQPSMLRYSLEWAGDTYTLRSASPTAPDGRWICGRLVVAKC